MKKEIDTSRDKIDFGASKIGLLFRSMFFPTLVGMLFMSAQTIIDGILVGRGVGAWRHSPSCATSSQSSSL